MLGKTKAWFKGLGTLGKTIALVSGSVLTFGVVGAATNPNSSPNQPQQPATQTVKQDTVEAKTDTTTESIPFTSSTVQDGTVASGTTKVKVAGSNGVKTKTWSVTYTNGVESSRTLKSEEVTTQSTNEIIAQGTYVAPTYTSCPNGTYTNTAGNVVCSPYNSNSTPVGATAQCRDGTYSFSQSRSGTCSHHGGVASWL